MRLFAVAAVLGLATPAFTYTTAYNLSSDSSYDNPNKSLKSVACAYGENGLITHGHKVFSDVRTYPYFGGAYLIHSPDSRYCGSCWELTYHPKHGKPVSLNFTAIDTVPHHHSEGFTISTEGFERITDGVVGGTDTVLVTAVRKPESWCNPPGKP